MTGRIATALVAAIFAVVVPSSAVAADDPVILELPFPCDEPWEGGTRAGHAGGGAGFFAMDFNQPGPGDPAIGRLVVASGPGVATVHANAGYGNFVDIDHGGGLVTRYAHLQDPVLVADGATVAMGSTIGTVGKTGSATAAHLHYEQRRDGVITHVRFGGFEIGEPGSPDPGYEVQSGGDNGADFVSRNCDGAGSSPDVAVLYVSNQLGSSTADSIFAFGSPTDILFAGDWNGDGSDSFTYRRGNVFTGSNELAGAALDVSFSFGVVGDELFLGDWDGDGVDTFAVRRGNVFHVANSNQSGPADVVLGYGKAGDEIMVGDWDGDGADSFAVRRGNVFFVSNTLRTGVAEVVFGYGKAGDTLLVGDWDGDQNDTFIVRRSNEYFVSNSLVTGPAEFEFTYGAASDLTFVGDWDGNGLDSFAARR